YVLQALGDLAWAPRRGDRIDIAETAEALGVVGQHRRLFRRMLEMLGEEGYLAEEAGTLVVAEPLPDAASIAGNASERPDLGGCQAEASLLERCGSSLAGVLTGTRDPLALLFPGGEFAAVEGLYRETPYA